MERCGKQKKCKNKTETNRNEPNQNQNQKHNKPHSIKTNQPKPKRNKPIQNKIITKPQQITKLIEKPKNCQDFLQTSILKHFCNVFLWIVEFLKITNPNIWRCTSQAWIFHLVSSNCHGLYPPCLAIRHLQ